MSQGQFIKYGPLADLRPVSRTPDLSSDECCQLKSFVAQWLGIPKEKVVPAEFKEANSHTSMIAVTFDTRLRSIEIGWVEASCVDLEDNEPNIPKDGATKNEARNCIIKGRMVDTLKR
jgi:hypothetical protein